MKKASLLVLLVFALVLGACAPAAPAEEAVTAEEAAPAEETAEEEIYIPVIALGFQHQFWQAVKTGCGSGCRGIRSNYHF